MSDIFISYASPDREHAKRIAEILESEGRSVWWDRSILPGQKYNKVIEEAINNAKCIMVLWSKSSIASDWVRDEAEVGRERENLIPILLENVPQPMGFRSVQFASLIDWDGESKKPFSPIFKSLEDILGMVPIAPDRVKLKGQPPPLAARAIGEMVTVEQQPSVNETIEEEKDDRNESTQQSKKAFKGSHYIFAFLGVVIIFTVMYLSMHKSNQNNYTEKINKSNDTNQSGETSSVPSTLKNNKLVDVQRKTLFGEGIKPTLNPLSSKISTNFKTSTETIDKATPSLTDKFVNLGWEAIKRNNYIEAQNNFRMATVYDKKNPFAWYYLGAAYELNSQPELALDCYDKVLQLDPVNEMAYYSKGIVLSQTLSDVDGALDAWEKLHEINPSFISPSGETIQMQIDSIKNR